MKARILAVGQKMPSWIQTGVDDYLKRIQPMLTTEIIEIPASKRSKNPSAADLEKYAIHEGNLISYFKCPSTNQTRHFDLS